MKTLAILIATACTAYAWEPTEDFVEYMMDVEGFRSESYRCAGGKLTIGYGHQITPNDTAKNHVDKLEARALLVADLKKAHAIAAKQLGYVPRGTFAEIAVDYTFNGCPPRMFPKFFRYAALGDKAGMRQEYKRHVGDRELVRRNNKFAERYL